MEGTELRLRRNNTFPKVCSATFELMKNVVEKTARKCIEHVIREEDVYSIG